GRTAAARRRVSRAALAGEGVSCARRPARAIASPPRLRHRADRTVAAVLVYSGLTLMAKTPMPTADDRGLQPLARKLTIAGRVLEPPEATLVDVVDELLNKGVMLTGDVTLGVAGIDLIYLRLSSILCAADRMFPPVSDRPQTAPRRKRRRRR